MRRPAVVLVLLLAAIAGACGHRGSTSAASPAAVTIPTSPVGEQLRWLLDEANKGGRGFAASDFQARMNPAFLTSVSPAQASSTVNQTFGRTTGWKVDSFPLPPRPTNAVAVVTNGSRRIEIQLSVESGGSHLISGLLLKPPPPLRPASWSAVDTRLSELAPRVAFFAGRVAGTTCTPVHQVHPADRLGIGSAFKLYVLGAVADSIRAGKLSWNDDVTVQDRLKSFPSGTLQNEPAGTKRTVSAVAGPMISISDNTAADHLLDRVGRDKVEAIQARMGHDEPPVNEPFLSTRELGVLKYGDASLGTRYADAGVAERRGLLREVDGRPLPPLAAFNKVGDARLEWFATPQELCRALATLHAWSAEPGLGQLDTILATNPGGSFGPHLAVVGYKGGSEPGVLAFAWLLRDDHNHLYSVSATFASPFGALDTMAAATVLTDAAQLLVPR